MIDLQKKKFLVIDDFPDFIKLMKRTLFALGANNMDEARSGEQAIELMKRNSYDIIMCDYNLGAGKKDGQQILEEAKHSELIRHSTVYIMLTAENTMTMVMGAVEYQPDAYLLKPISKEVLGKRIETLLLKKADFENIEAAIARKEYNSAIALCEEKIKTSPKNKLEYLKLKSDLCIRAGNLEAASVVFEEVLAIRDIPWAKLGRGKVYFLEGSYLNAREIFQAIIQENKMFMEAYDWLAKTLEELEDMDSAKRVLINATEISPKAILRHQNIGNLAFKTNDFDKAAEAFNAAINIGKNSCYKNASDYTGLAKTLVHTDSSEGALEVLQAAREEFKGDRNAMLQTSVAECTVYKDLGRDDDAKKSIQEASKIHASLGGAVPVQETMELAKACFSVGDKATGISFMQEVVKDNHDNDKVINMVEDAFEVADLQEEGAKIIAATQKEMIKLNNEGVSLVEQGRLKDAIDFFEKAAGRLPENKIINANAAHALLMFMEKNAVSDKYLFKASQYIDRLKRIDPAYDKYKKLLFMYEKLKNPT